MLEVGEVVERYEVEALLGGGGLAAVYRVRHLQLGTVHALKVLLLTTPTDRARLLAEGQVQARLRHPNVVAVTDVLQVNRSPALVMELVDGPSLDKWLGDGPVPVPVALALFRGIVAGVGAAHAAGVVHRDLKPSNVLLARSPTGALVAKVTDFGLVRMVGGDQLHTQTGSALGTPAYMAPEQIRDPSGVDHRADLWALGCLLYELVCGHRAFPARDPFQLYTAVGAGSYEDPGAKVPDAPLRVLEAIRNLLRVDPDSRIKSCIALWEQLWDDPPPVELQEGPKLSLGEPATVALPPSTSTTSSTAPTPTPPHTRTTPTPATPTPFTPAPALRSRRTETLLAAAAVCIVVLLLACVGLLGFIALPDGAAEAVAGASGEPAEATAGGADVGLEAAATAQAAEPEPEVIRASEIPGAPPPRPEPSLAPDPAAQVPPADRARQGAPAAPAPASAPQATGSVRVEGDAREVWLEAGGQRVRPGPGIRPGRYEVRATWSDGREYSAGTIRVRPGEETRVRCASFVGACKELGQGAP